MDVVEARVAPHRECARISRQSKLVLGAVRGRIAEIELPMRRFAPIGRALAAAEREQRAPVVARWRRHADPLQDRRHDVHRLGEGRDLLSGCCSGIADDERDVVRFGEVAFLAEHPVIAEHLAMIAGDDDQCFIGEAPFLDLAEQPAELCVHLADHAAIGRAELREIGGRQRGHRLARAREEAAALLPAQVMREQRVLTRFRRRVLRRAGRRHVGRPIHRVERRRCHERRVRGDVADMREPRLRPPHREIAQHGVGEERAAAVAGMGAGGSTDRAAVGRRAGGRQRVGNIVEPVSGLLQVREPRPRVLRQQQFGREAGHHAFVAVQRGISRIAATRVRRAVGVAEQSRVVAGAARLQCDRGDFSGQRRAVPQHLRVVLVEAGQQRGASGTARCGLREMIVKQRAVPGQTVEIGCADVRIARRPQRVGAPLVERH